jgi:hypothetical protein
VQCEVLIEFASSVDLLGQYANWSGTRVSGIIVDVCHDQPFKALNDHRCECYRAVVIVAGSLRIIGNTNDGGQHEACGDDSSPSH